MDFLDWLFRRKKPQEDQTIVHEGVTIKVNLTELYLLIYIDTNKKVDNRSGVINVARQSNEKLQKQVYRKLEKVYLGHTVNITVCCPSHISEYTRETIRAITNFHIEAQKDFI